MKRLLPMPGLDHRHHVLRERTRAANQWDPLDRRLASIGAAAFLHFLRLRSRFGQGLGLSGYQNLLRAALFSGDEAKLAWEHIRPQFNIDRLGPESVRLLPLLYRNLESIQADDPVLPRLRGLYRQTWYKNQILFHDMETVLRRFNATGLEALVVRGMAIALRYYGDFGLRPMNAFDLLIQPPSAPEAFRLVEELGWSPIDMGASMSDRCSRRFQSSRSSCRIHWSVPGVTGWDQARNPNGLWSHTQWLTAKALTVRTLSPHDELAWTCLRGTKGGWRPRLQWVADTAMILRHQESALKLFIPQGLAATIRLEAATRFLVGTTPPTYFTR